MWDWLMGEDYSYGGGDNSALNYTEPSGNYNWAISNGSAGADSGDGFDWGGLLGAGMGAASQYYGGKAKGKMSKEEIELQAKLNKEYYQFRTEQDEAIYQKHGQQLADAYKGFEQYKNETAPSPFAILNQGQGYGG